LGVPRSGLGGLGVVIPGGAILLTVVMSKGFWKAKNWKGKDWEHQTVGTITYVDWLHVWRNKQGHLF